MVVFGGGDNMTVATPEWLYHYASIDVLALILNNRTIRFRRLDLMDDPNEALTSDLGRQGKYVMASCWTDRSDEELLIWSLYTKDLRGVRIRLPAFPFDKKFKVDPAKLPTFITNQVQDSYISSEQLFNDQYCIPGPEPRLVKVEYTDDRSLLYPKVYENDGTHSIIILGNLGKYKRTVWERQSEWRYVFEVYPVTREIYRKLQAGKVDEVGGLWLEAMIREQDPGIQHIDIPIRQDALDEITITLGPRTTESDRIIVKSLVDRFTANATISESDLRGEIV